VSAVVAEDDEGLNRLICKQLERRGMKLVGVHSGADAIVAIQQHPDCLLLLDYVLLDMDGHQLLDRLNTMGLRVPFIVMTGRGDERLAVEMMKLGARDYLVKQPDFLELVPPVVERVLWQLETERRLGRAEQAVRESEERFRRIIETAYEGFWALDADCRTNHANPRLAAMLGCTVEDLLGRPTEDFLFPEDVPAHVERIARRRDGESGTYELRLRRKDGSECWTLASASPLLDAQGRYSGSFAMLSDITERKETETALYDAARRWRATFDGINDAVCILSPEGTILQCNTTMERLGGRSAAELAGRSCCEVVHGSAQPRDDCPLAKGRKTLVRERSEIRLGDRTVEVTVDPLLDESGRLAGAVHIVADVTERKRAEEAVRDSEEKYRNVVERANDGIIIVQDGILKFANTKMAELDGSSVERLIGTPYTDHVYPDEVPRLTERYRRRIAGEDVPHVYETVLRRADGSPAPAELNAGLVTFEGRSADMIVVRDITERKRAEEALRKSEERFRTLHETMAQGVIYQLPDGAIVSANKAAERILGLTINQMQGRTSADPRWRAIHEDGSDFPGETHASMVALRTGREVHGVIMGVFNPPLESYRWISIDAVPQFHPGEDKPYQVFTTFTDITELRTAGEAARQAGVRAQEYLDIASVMLVAMDTTGMVTLINRRGCEVLGWAEREAVGKDWFETFLPERTRPDMRTVFRRLLAGEPVGPEYSECLVLTRSGDERVIAWHDQLLHDETGGVTGILSSGEDVTERKRTEEALRTERERAQTYLDVAGVVLVALDANGRITLINRCGSTLLGYREDELVGRDWFAVCVPERMRDEVKGVFSWLMVGAVQPVEYYETYVVTRSGEERLIAWHNVALHDESGTVTGTLSSGEDITARRQAEHEAQAERDQLRRILDGMPDGVYVVGRDYELQYVNPSLRARGGPVNGRKCHEYFHGRTEPCPDCTNSQVFAGVATRHEYATKQGVTYEIQDVPVAGNDGRPARLAFMRDVTERKRAEERDRQHLADTALLRDTALGFITLNPDTDIYHYIAQRLAGLAGEAYIVVNSYDATRDEFCVRAIEGIGKGAADVLKLLGRPPVGMTFKLAPEELRDYSSSTLMKIEGGLRALSFGRLPEVVMATVESVFRPGDIYAMSFYWQEKILGTVNIIMRQGADLRDPAVAEAFINQAAIALQHKLDADELDRHRENLEELVAERTRELTAAQGQLVQHGKLMTLGRVAGSVAHEIRNPLGAIKNASWFLQKNAADKLEGKSLRHLHIIDDNIETANRAITAILDFTWRLQGEPKKCALRPLLERAVVEATIHGTVSVHLDVRPGLPHVLVDDRQIVAVFRNLFTNAAQAMPGGGTLRVAARRKYGMVIVDVADTGSGIKPEHLARVFEPLFTTKDIGIGLGLAICKDFVEANKGTITVVSKVGEGTTFTVTLPTAEEQTTSKSQ
jgi:PAS domain S-box-containing protein